MNCPICKVEMIESNATPIGLHPPNLDSFYFIHPKSDCKVADAVVRMGYKI